MSKKLTIQDIARLAGVSKATVSRVLNHHQNVDPLTREQVLKVVREQSFVPNITASNLAGGRSRLLGALVPSLSWPLVPDLMRGIGDVIADTGYELILYSITDLNHEKDHSATIGRIMGSNLVAGLLAVFPGASGESLAALHSPDFPVVFVDDQLIPTTDLPWISVDNRAGSYTATRHLLQLGHTRIAHIQGPQHYRVSHERLQGYLDALTDAGITPDANLILEGDFMPPSGREITSRFLSLSDRPTAIFAGSDYMAYGAITATVQHGLRIPQDMAIVGFDDNPTSAHMSPALTTIKQPFFEMGQSAINLLLSLVATARAESEPKYTVHISPTETYTTGSNAHSHRVKFPATLVIRQTCGATV